MQQEPQNDLEQSRRKPSECSLRLLHLLLSVHLLLFFLLKNFSLQLGP